MRFRYLAVSAASLIAAAGPALADGLTLKRVVLSSGGLGLYQYEAEVDGDATLELKAPLSQIDDILKSLVVFDDHGGVGGLELPSAEPLSATFRNLSFTAEDLQSSAALIGALKGAEVEVGGPHAMIGRIVSVSEETRQSANGQELTPRHRVTVLTDNGLQPFVLEDADSVRFIDSSLNDELGKALQALSDERGKDARTLRLTDKGTGKRKVEVAYVVSAPLWKASYRLALPAEANATSARLQGWATLENLSGQDWSGVDLTLTSGAPVTYRQALYRAYFVDRPEAPVEVVGRLLTQPDEGEVATESAAEPHAAPMRAKALGRALPLGADLAAPAPAGAAPEPPPPEPALAGGTQTTPAQQGLTQVSFHIPFPVDVADGHTLSLPILDASAPVERLALYAPNVDARHPLSAVRLVNDGKSGLPPGIVTLYEQSPAGAAFIGDARLSAVPAGESRLIAYALDQKTLIEARDSETAAFVRGILAKGTFNVETLQRRETNYVVKAAEPRRLVVPTPVLDGWKLAEPASAQATQSEGEYRIPFDVKAGDGQRFTVAEERTETRLVGLANVDDGNLGFYLRAREIDPATHDKLAKLADLRAKQTAAERALSDIAAQSDEMAKDQNRLKDLLGALGSSSDLQKRYLGKLDADETKLDELKAKRAERQKARDEARKAIEDYLASL